MALLNATARLLLLAGGLFAVAGGPVRAASGDTIAQVKARGVLRCGVSEGIIGFSRRDASGRRAGLDADVSQLVVGALYVLALVWLAR